MGGLARRYLRPSNVFLLRMISRITRSPSRTSIPCRRGSPPLVRCSTSHSVRMRTQRKPAASKADPISDRSLRLDTYTCFFIVSVVEVIVFVRRRVERRKFAVSFPFPDGIAPLRKIPCPADSLGLGGECPQPIAAVCQFVDHSSVLLDNVHKFSVMDITANFITSSCALPNALSNSLFTSLTAEPQ